MTARALCDAWPSVGGSWGSVLVECECGQSASAMSNRAILSRGLRAACATCGARYDDGDDSLATQVDHLVHANVLDVASAVLARKLDVAQRVADVLAACPHCGAALTGAEARAAARAVIRLVLGDDGLERLAKDRT